MKKTMLSTMLLSAIIACSSPEEKKQSDQTTTAMEFKFDSLINGKKTSLYWLGNDSIKIGITNYGGRIVSLQVPDKNGKLTETVVGFSSLKDFIQSTERYFGATIGRVGNRIANGKFTLNGNN